MTQIALNKSPARSTSRLPARIAIAAAGLVLIGVAIYALSSSSASSGNNGAYKTVPVIQGPFVVRVEILGDLQAVDNIEIISEVEGSNTITQLVPEGASVNKGDVLAVLDSSVARQKLEDATIELQRITADVTAASELLEIQKSQNAANQQTAEVELQLAQISLRSYNEGLWPQMLADAKMSVEKAEVGLRTKQDELQQTRSLFAKGFVTATEVKNKETEVSSADRDVTKARTDLRVLTDFSHEADSAAKRNTLAQAEQKLARTARENTSNLSQREAELRAKQQQMSVITRRVERFKIQVEKTTLLAPAEGLVVYNNQRSGDQPPVQEGVQVRERQVILRLPDTTRMKVVIKANETQVGRLNVNQLASVVIASLGQPVSGWVSKISPVPDSTGGRWGDPDRKDYPIDITLDWTPAGLRPGMSGRVSVLVDQAASVQSMPIAALYTAGNVRYAFVPDGNIARPVEIKIGRTNEQDVEIVSGLDTGTAVILLEAGQGKVLLERAGINVDDAASKNGQANDRSDNRKAR